MPTKPATPQLVEGGGTLVNADKTQVLGGVLSAAAVNCSLSLYNSATSNDLAASTRFNFGAASGTATEFPAYPLLFSSGLFCSLAGVGARAVLYVQKF